MKLRRNLSWISTIVGTASAFKSNFSRMPYYQLQRNGDSSLTPVLARKISLAGDKLPTHQRSMVLSAKKSPYPPDYIPRVDEQLETDLMESERRVMLYEKEVEMIREQLGLKQIELLEEQNTFRDEKRTLMGKITEFTSVLAQRDKELEIALKQDKNEKADDAKQLEGTIRSLETELQQKTNSLENEKKIKQGAT